MYVPYVCWVVGSQVCARYSSGWLLDQKVRRQWTIFFQGICIELQYRLTLEKVIYNRQVTFVSNSMKFLREENVLVHSQELLPACHPGVTPDAASGGLQVQGKPRLPSETLLGKQNYRSLNNLLSDLL